MVTNINKKYTILCDIDDTAWGLVYPNAWLEIFNEKTGCNIKYEDIKSWAIDSYIPKEHRKLFWDILEMEELWDRIQPLPDSQKYIKAINEEYNFYFATSTHWSNATMKARRLQRLFPFIDVHKQLIIASNKHMLNADLILDDAEHNMLGFSGNKLLFTRPWNEDFNCAKHGVWRVNNWDEVYKAIQTLLPTE